MHNRREAYDLFLDGEALGLFSHRFKKVSVDDVYVGYYIESQTELQEYLMPVMSSRANSLAPAENGNGKHTY